MDEAVRHVFELFLNLQTVDYKQLKSTAEFSGENLPELIEKLNRELGSTAQIVELNNDAFSLMVLNQTEFDDKFVKCVQTDNNQNYRVSYIAIKILSKEECKIEQLADILYVSTRQISKDLVLVRELLNRHNIELKNIPYHGLQAKGTELDQRICLAEVMLQQQNLVAKGTFNDQKMAERYDKIKAIVSKVLDNNQFSISDYAFENLIVHLFIAVLRVENGNQIDLAGAGTHLHSENIKIATEIVNSMSKEFNVVFGDYEKEYVAVHIESKRNYSDTTYSDNIPPEISELAISFLSYADAKYGLELHRDFKLCMTLSMHFYPLVYRLKYGFNQNNPLLNEIKKNYLYEFEIAQDASLVINQKYDCQLSEDEIGYIALDVAMSLQNRYIQSRYSILLVCATGRGSAEMLKISVLNLFKEYISSVELCSSRDAERQNLDQYDYIFTTVPLFVNTKTPVLRISTFLHEKEINNIQSLLSDKASYLNSEKYFDQHLFMGECDFSDKNDALKRMCNCIRKYRDIPEGFLDAVFERENAADTSFGNDVAFPHPIKVMTKETFVCVAVAKKKLDWGTDHQVQLILLASIGDHNREELQSFYNTLSKLVQNSDNVQKLIRNPEYRVLSKIISSN